MIYYLIFIIIWLVVAILSDTNTWSPFQSEQVKEICSHMTRGERRAAINRAALWGLIIGIIPGSIGLICGPIIFRSALLGVMFCALIAPLIACVLWKKWLPHVNKSQQTFLASTEWARSQGIKADDIRLFSWQK